MTAMLTMPAERAILRRLVSGAGEATESSRLAIVKQRQAAKNAKNTKEIEDRACSFFVFLAFFAATLQPNH